MKHSYSVKTLARFIPCFLFFAFSVLEAPVLTNIESDVIRYTPGSSSIIVSEKINIEDHDGKIVSATIKISQGYVSGEDVLDVADFEGITSVWDNGTGTLTLSGTEKVSTYKKVLRKVQYVNNAASNATAGERVITFTVSDSTSNSNSLSRTVNVVAPEPTPQPEPQPDPQPKPQASIAGSDDICQGESAQLNITFQGEPPFDVIVMKDDSVYKQLDNLQTLSYKLEVNNAGSYSLSGLKDANTDGTTSGTATITSNSTPTANISGDASLCGGGETALSVTLTGTAPWRFSYRLNSGTPVLIQDITSSPGKVTVNEAGNYTLVEVYDKNCKGAVSGKAVVEFTSAPDVSISGLGTSYSNSSADWVEISGTPSGGEFTGNGILRYQSKWYFLPSLAKIGNNRIVYKYRSSSQSCYGYDTATVRIFESTAEIIFNDERTTFCSNEKPFMVKGESMTSSNTGSFQISGGTGLKDNGDNTAIIDPSLLTDGKYTITYTAGDGIAIERGIEIGQALEAEFTWETECFTPGAAITFTNTTRSPFGFLDDESFKWKIYNQSDSVLLTSKNISYNFPEPGNYVVELSVLNSNGCYDTASRVIPLRPVVKLAGENYFENFEEESSWYSENNPDMILTSWVLGTPQKHGFPSHGFRSPYSGEKAWFTDIVQSPVPQEESWISSPCFDFTGTEKPTFVSHVWRLFTDNRDGSNLQYTIDNGKTWLPVGGLNDGINWFNGYYGKPGIQTIGWTAVYDTGWIEVRHDLDFLKGKNEVQFRFIYSASGDAIGNDGIAVDDIKIVERNRTVLMEHFTNSTDRESILADSLLNIVVQNAGANVIALQYHTDQPGEDPLNIDNPVMSGARQFYYNVTGVPYTIINGGLQQNQRIDYSGTLLNDDRISIESLYDSDFNIDVTSMIQDDTMYVEAAITSLFDVPLSELAVRIAVLESEIEDPSGSSRIFRNVVKSIIPEAAGQILYRSWLSGEKLYVRGKWGLEKVYNPDNLRAVAFIQNESSREVLQASLDKRGTVTGSNKAEVDQEGPIISIYPNPAKEIAYIDFNGALNRSIQVELINNLGQIVISSKAPEGTTIFEIPARGYSPGLYMLRLSNENGIIRNIKIIIAD